ncbi:putative Cullin family/Cullin protein neddylation domain containing protein [Leishmania naiffi]|uniref:Cullin family/Cullin protein neddylation domain containing protein n=1 Tax=Leishmania naiffi TaxID=5678 RepID=A0AAW3B2I3_9TRYP
MSSVVSSRKRMAEYSTFSDKWGIIEETVLCIFKKEVSRNSFQRIHHSVFQLCQAHYGSQVLERLEEQLYAQVSTVLHRIEDSSLYVADFLREWQDYNDSVSQISNVLLYFNKNYMYACHHSSIEHLGERIFCSSTLGNPEVSARLIASIKQSIHVPAAESIIRDIGQELYTAEGSKYFVRCMESPFVDAIVDKYAAQGEQQKQALTTNSYLQWVQSVVSSESHKYADTFFYILLDKLTKALYSSLVLSDPSSVDDMLTGPTGLVHMLEEWDVTSISTVVQVFCAMKREKDVIDVIAQALKEKSEGIINDRSTSVFPFPGVQKMLQLIERAKELDGLFTAEEGHSQSPFLRVIRNVLGSDTRFMETLSVYYDSGIRQGKDDVVSTVGNNVLTILQLTPDLEAFEVAFRSHLAVRLIYAKPHAVDMECRFIDRLFNIYGSSVVNRFQKMVEDIRSATAAQEKLVADMKTKKISPPLEFDVLVLTSGLWPQYTNIPLSIPQSMESCKHVFQEYYRRRHNGRKLVFQMSLGSIAFQLCHRGRTYHVSAHTHFVNSIMALNSDEDVSVAVVARQGALSSDEVLTHFNTLCHVGLAERNGTEFRFNRRFYSSKSKVKVSAGVQKSAHDGSGGAIAACKGMDGARTMSLDATIVKLLKEHNSIDYHTLCCAIESELRDVCSPTRTDIKLRVDALMEKGLLMRGESANCYVYCS